ALRFKGVADDVVAYAPDPSLPEVRRMPRERRSFALALPFRHIADQVGMRGDHERAFMDLSRFGQQVLCDLEPSLLPRWCDSRGARPSARPRQACVAFEGCRLAVGSACACAS